MIEPDDNIQRLIRLKRYEQPPEGFVNDFMISFHERQRSEMLHKSSLSLMWERLTTYFEGTSSPNMGMAGAAAALAIIGVIWLMPHGGSDSVAVRQPDHGGTVVPWPRQGDTSGDIASLFGTPEQDQSKVVSPDRFGAVLLSKHFGGGYADDAWNAANGSIDEPGNFGNVSFKLANEPELKPER